MKIKRIGVLLLSFFVISGLLISSVTVPYSSKSMGGGSDFSVEGSEMQEYEIRIMRPLLSVPEIQERGQSIDIWVRNPAADENTTWEAVLFKEYTADHTEEYELDIMDLEEAEDKPGEHNWYLTVEIPEEARDELYDLELSDGEESAVSIHSVKVVEDIDDRFDFVQVTDTHLGYVDDGEPKALQRIKRFIEEMNLIRPDFIIMTGDASDKEPLWWSDQNPHPSEQDEKFYDIIQDLEVPIYTESGNHDHSYTNDDDPDYNIQSYRKWINPHLNYTFTYGDEYHFTMQNSGKYVSLTNSDGEMTMENVTWMENVLDENMNKTMRFVCQHHPVYPDTIDDDGVRDAFRQAVVDHDVEMVFAGHTHESTIYDSQGNATPDDPTEGETPLHVTTGDLVKSAVEYRYVQINGSEVESLTYDTTGDGERDPVAAMPLGQIGLDYSPPNDGTNSEVVATIENNLYENFSGAFIDFTVPAHRPGFEYKVENGTVFEEIDAGEEKIFYVNTDVEKAAAKQVTIKKEQFIETLPPTDLGITEATINGWLPDVGAEVETFFRFREEGEGNWSEVALGAKAGPENLSYDLSSLDPLQKYEFKAGIEVGEGADEREITGETLSFVPADLSRTVQVKDEWQTNESMNGLQTEWNDLVLQMEDQEESFKFRGEREVYPVENYTHMEVEMLGAGGGGAVNGGDWSGGRGGDGGKMEGVFDVSEFSELHIYVGEGGQTGDGSSTTPNPGGWGASHGGATLGETFSYGSPHAGAGGGSTEIIGVTSNGTKVWLAAADAGGGGGETEELTFAGDTDVGGGGGGAGGLGGKTSTGDADGDDAETTEEGSTPRDSNGTGGDGGGADRDVPIGWPGDSGGYDYNDDYLLDLWDAEVGGYTGSGGKTNYNNGEYDPYRDGENGEIQANFIDLGTVEGERISEPLVLGDLERIEE
ncbi:MAG: metallophosphoesterase, partial [Candidatus Aenigmatarchaeota archaeon]